MEVKGNPNDEWFAAHTTGSDEDVVPPETQPEEILEEERDDHPIVALGNVNNVSPIEQLGFKQRLKKIPDGEWDKDPSGALGDAVEGDLKE